MCSIIDKLIAQTFKGEEIYSNTISRAFDVVGPNLELVIDYRKENARAIILHSVILSIGANAVVILTLIDDMGNTLIQFAQTTSQTGIYHLNHYLPSGKIKLVIAGGSGKILATAQYQYIMFRDKTT